MASSSGIVRIRKRLAARVVPRTRGMLYSELLVCAVPVEALVRVRQVIFPPIQFQEEELTQLGANIRCVRGLARHRTSRLPFCLRKVLRRDRAFGDIGRELEPSLCPQKHTTFWRQLEATSAETIDC